MAQSLYRIVVQDPQSGAQSYLKNSAKWNAINETARDAVKQLGYRVLDIQVLGSDGQYVTDTKAMEELQALFNGKGQTAGNPVTAFALGQFAETCKAMAKDLKKSDLSDEDVSEWVHEFVHVANMLGVQRELILKATKSA